MIDLSRHSYEFVSFFHCEHAEKCVSEPSVNADSHLIHVLRGQGHMLLGQKRLSLRPGCVAAIPSFSSYQMVIHPYFEMMNIHFKLHLPGAVFWDSIWALPPVFSPPYFAETAAALTKMSGLDNGNRSDRLRLAAISYSVVAGHLAENQLVPTSTIGLPDPGIREAELLIRSDTSGRYEAAKFARAAHLSVSQFNRKFLRLYGLPPQRHWRQIRFQKACALLRDGSLSLQDIADRLGFCDQYHLSKWFKSLSGSPPRQYRLGLQPL